MQQAVQIIQDLRNGDPNQKIRAVKAAGAYVKAHSYFPEAVPLLIQLLNQDQFSRLAEEAAWALWKFKDKRAIPHLLKKAQGSPFPLIREKAIRALGLLTAKEALSFFREKLTANPFASAREKAAVVFALGFLKDPGDLKIVKKFLTHPSPLLRQETLWTLLRFYRQNAKHLSFFVIRKLFRMCRPFFESSAEVRSVALQVLCLIKPQVGRKRLEKACLKDPSEWVRAKSFALLKDWICLETEQGSLRGMKDLSWKVRSAAYRLLTLAVSQNRVWEREKVMASLEVAHEIFPSHLR